MNPNEMKLKLYELYLTDLGRIGGRHETARQFYIGVITALIAFLTLAGKEGFFTPIAPWVGVIGAAVGAAVCLLWINHMRSFSTLFSVKTEILRALETGFDPKPFTIEHANTNMQRRTRLTEIDQWGGWAFLVLFLLLAVACLVFWRTVDGSAPAH